MAGQGRGKPDIWKYAKKAGTTFSKDYQPNPANRLKRKVSVLQEYVMDTRASKDDIRKVSTAILDMNLEELKELCLKKDTPLFVVGFATACLKDMARGNVTALNLLAERAFGKPDEYKEINQTIQSQVIEMSRDEIEKKKKELLAKQGYKKSTDSENKPKKVTKKVIRETMETVESEADKAIKEIEGKTNGNQ